MCENTVTQVWDKQLQMSGRNRRGLSADSLYP